MNDISTTQKNRVSPWKQSVILIPCSPLAQNFITSSIPFGTSYAILKVPPTFSFNSTQQQKSNQVQLQVNSVISEVCFFFFFFAGGQFLSPACHLQTSSASFLPSEEAYSPCWPPWREAFHLLQGHHVLATTLQLPDFHESPLTALCSLPEIFVPRLRTHWHLNLFISFLNKKRYIWQNLSDL